MKKKIICLDVNHNPVETNVSELKFRPSIYGVLVEDGKILLSKQWDGWDIPGGGIEIDETIEEALVREFKEETGLEIKPIKPIYCRTSFFAPNLSNEGQFWNSVMIYFLVEKIGGEISIDQCCNDEKKYMKLPEWIETEKAKTLKFYNTAENGKIIDEAVKFVKKNN